MNILQIFNGFADRWNANGYYRLTLAVRLSGLGHPVICVADPDCSFTRKTRERSLRTFDLTVDTDNPLRYFSVVRQIRRLIRENDIDVINCHRGKIMAAFIRAARTSGRKVTVVRTHGEDRLPNTHLLARLESRSIDKYIVTTEKLKTYYLSRFNIDESDIKVIYGGASHPIHSETQRIKPSPPGKQGMFTIGILGRSSAVKGHRTAIEALKQVAEAVSIPVVLKLAGGKKQKSLDEFRTFAQEHGLSETQVDIVGWVENPAEFIAHVDMGLIPSLGSEMICRVLMEFIAFGKPVFGSDVNAVGEVIRTFNIGLTSPPGQPDRLAENIIEAVNNPSRMDEWAEHASRAYESVFSPRRFAEITSGFYTG